VKSFSVSGQFAFALALLAALSAPSLARAAAGDLDSSFGTGGLVTTGFGDIDEAHSVAIDSQGRIVAAGRNGAGNFALVRYRPNGELDPSFSSDGKVKTSFGDFAAASSVAIDSRGRIVAAGRTRSDGDKDFALARYLRDGSLDDSFSGNGKLVTDLGGQEGATSMAIDRRGRIVAVGDRGFRARHIAVARYKPNGALDRSFSRDGKRRTGFGVYLHVSSVATDSRNRIVVAGTTHSPSGANDFAVLRFRPDGGLDDSFSRDGKRKTNFGGYDDANSVAIDSRGRIVAAGFASGYRSDGSGSDFALADFALARYRQSGRLDDAFSGNGKVTTGFGTDGLKGAANDATSVAIDSRDRVVAAGVTQTNARGQDFALARYRASGSLDRSFSGNGRLRTSFGRYDRARSVTIDLQGRIVAAGETQDSAGGEDFALARYLGG
jgi:uncharacterized delta-60 repeat protein